MNADWAIWRPVVAKHGSLCEVKYAWTICDLFDSHEILDELEAQEREQAERSRK